MRIAALLVRRATLLLPTLWLSVGLLSVRLLPIRLLSVRLLPIRLLSVRLLPIWLLPVRLIAGRLVARRLRTRWLFTGRLLIVRVRRRSRRLLTRSIRHVSSFARRRGPLHERDLGHMLILLRGSFRSEEPPTP